MPHDSWVSCRQELDELVSLLLAEKDYVVQDQVEEYDDLAEREPEKGEDGKVKRVKVVGSIVGLVENLDNEVSSTKPSLRFLLTPAVHQDIATHRCP